MKAWRGDLLLTLTFFSRIPAGSAHRAGRLADAVWLLPVTAVLIALGPAGAMVAAVFFGVPALGAAFIAVAALAAVTGALHEDGFADCADGFFGGAERARRLEIMADSRLGTYGVLALILAVGLKAALLAPFVADPLAAACVFVAAAVVARTLALFPWVGLPSAREGLAAAMGRPSPSTFRLAAAIGAGLALLLMLPVGIGALLAGLGLSIAAVIGVARLADRLIGGHTGDVIGAAVVAADLAYFLGVTIWMA